MQTNFRTSVDDNNKCEQNVLLTNMYENQEMFSNSPWNETNLLIWSATDQKQSEKMSNFQPLMYNIVGFVLERNIFVRLEFYF